MDREKRSSKEKAMLREGIMETDDDVMEKPLRGCSGFLLVYECLSSAKSERRRRRNRYYGVLTCSPWPQSVEARALEPSENSVPSPLPNTYLHFGIFHPTHVAWISATVLYHFISAMCVLSKCNQPCSIRKVKFGNCWQPIADPWAVTHELYR